MPIVEPTPRAPKDDSRPFSGRTLARQRAVDVLYAADLRGQRISDAVDAWLENARHNLEGNLPQSEPELARQARAQAELDSLDSFQYARTIALGVAEHQASIDELIDAYARDWTLARMPKVDLAILRVATWELLYNDEVPTAVAIAEAGKLAQVLSTDSSPRFVSGVLHGIAESA